MVLENETIALVSSLPFPDALPALVNTVQVLVGGIFGLYLLQLVLRWYQGKRQQKTLDSIRYDVRAIAEKMGIKEPYVSRRERMMQKINTYLKTSKK